MNLNYTPFEIPGLAPDEAGYQVTETGQCASVRLTRASGAAPSMFGFTACAFALEADGSPTLTADLKTIEGWHTVSCSKSDLLVGGSLSLDKVAELKAAATEKALLEMLSIISTEDAFNDLGI